MEKLYTSKTFLKMFSERMHTSHPNPLDPLLAISYNPSKESGIQYFSHLEPLIFFFTKRQSQKRGGA